jgi:hypothetical protein
MNIRWNTLIVNAIATAVMWGGAFVSTALLGDSSPVSILAGLTALGGSAALWIVWALNILDPGQAERFQALNEKAKRGPNDDARLSLLLHLMSDDERQSLKQRLADELGSDGESVSLAALLAAQNKPREK